MLISDKSLISALQAVSSDVVQVSEFTTVLDDRKGAPTVRYLIELAGELGMSNKASTELWTFLRNSISRS